MSGFPPFTGYQPNHPFKLPGLGGMETIRFGLLPPGPMPAQFGALGLARGSMSSSTGPTIHDNALAAIMSDWNAQMIPPIAYGMPRLPAVWPGWRNYG